MYPMTDPRRKSLRGAPWDGPSLTCHKKRSPNMGTKTECLTMLYVSANPL